MSEPRMPPAENVLAPAGNTTRSMPELVGHLDGVQAAGAAEGQQGEARGSRPFSNRLRRMAAARLVLVRVSTPSAAWSTARPSGSAERGRARRGRRARPARMAPPRKKAGSRRPRTQVGVGDGRLRAAMAVAGRAGPGAGAARPHGQAPAGVDRGDGAAAGADGADLDHREAHRQAVDLALGHLGDRAVATTQTSKLVPPMSTPTRSGMPSRGEALRRQGAAARAGQQQPHRLLGWPSRRCTRRRWTAPAAAGR